jgi:hypothetical protein
LQYIEGLSYSNAFCLRSRLKLNTEYYSPVLVLQ